MQLRTIRFEEVFILLIGGKGPRRISSAIGQTDPGSLHGSSIYDGLELDCDRY
jgi:hypothetical protein